MLTINILNPLPKVCWNIRHVNYVNNNYIYNSNMLSRTGVNDIVYKKVHSQDINIVNNTYIYNSLRDLLFNVSLNNKFTTNFQQIHW